MKRANLMKVLGLMIVGLLPATGLVFADQWWTSSGNNIYNTNSGYIGIGTATPNANLEVYNANNTSELRITSGSNGVAKLGFNDVGNAYAYIGLDRSTGSLTFNPIYNFEAVRITPTGYIGVGTTSPYAKFHVKQGSADTVGIRISRAQVDGNPMLQFSDDVTYNNNIQLIAGTYNFAIAPNFGNVGIGTTNPGAKLHVNSAGESLIWGSGTTTYLTVPKPGAGNFIGKGNTSDYRIALQDSNGRVNHYWNAYCDDIGYKYITSEAAARFLMSVNGTTGGLMAFFGAPSGTAGAAITWVGTGCLSSNDKVWFSPRGAPSDLYINNSGYIGIGTTNPQSTLAVNGTITTKKVKVTETGWSDFVFDDGYKLPTLMAVESHIKQYKHLPGIPSATEIKQKGLDVSDVLAKQMQKIEELTLYMIEMQKKNEEVQKENQDLKKRINALEKQVTQN